MEEVNALDLIDKFDLGGTFFCSVDDPSILPQSLRTLARKVSDEFFPDLGGKKSKYYGTIFRFQKDGPNKTITGYLTRKEALFGEFGRPNHEPLVTFSKIPGAVLGDLVIVTYQDLSEADLEYLQQVLIKMGLREIE